MQKQHSPALASSAAPKNKIHSYCAARFFRVANGQTVCSPTCTNMFAPVSSSAVGEGAGASKKIFPGFAGNTPVLTTSKRRAGLFATNRPAVSPSGFLRSFFFISNLFTSTQERKLSKWWWGLGLLLLLSFFSSSPSSSFLPFSLSFQPHSFPTSFWLKVVCPFLIPCMQ